MGYWSEHPMAGDAPMDRCGELLDRYDDEDTGIAYYESDALKEFIERDFFTLLTEAEHKKNFVFPWICFDYNVTIPLEAFERVKALIGDGDSSARSYSEEDRVSPYKYAKLLHDNFEEYSKDNAKYREDMSCPGLFDTIFLSGKGGLVNSA